MEPMSSMDASFLHLETANKPMHIGGVSIFEGPAPPLERLQEMVRGKLGLVAKAAAESDLPANVAKRYHLAVLKRQPVACSGEPRAIVFWRRRSGEH